jgi:hypothetical protein
LSAAALSLWLTEKEEGTTLADRMGKPATYAGLAGGPGSLFLIVRPQRKRGSMKRAALLIPILLFGLAGCGKEFTYEGTYVVVKAPDDDEPLRKWLEEQPGVRDVSVTREGKTVRVRYATRGDFHYDSPPLKELGYEASSSGWKISGSSRLVHGLPDWVVFISAIVAGTAILEGVKWLWHRRKGAEPKAPVDAGRDAGSS